MLCKRMSGNQDFEYAIDVSRGTESNGRIHRRSSEAGEGDGADLTVEKHKPTPVGSSE